MGRTKKEAVKDGCFDVDAFLKQYAYTPGANERKLYEQKARIKKKYSKHKKQ